MIMNLGGVLTDLPVYDQEGNYVAGGDPEAVKATDVLNKCKDIISGLSNSSISLEAYDDVNIYNYILGDPEVDCEMLEEGDCDPSQLDYYGVIVHGGQNGSGKWSTYLLALHELLERLEDTFQDVWIISMDIDVPDDVFDVEIGILP